MVFCSFMKHSNIKYKTYVKLCKFHKTPQMLKQVLASFSQVKLHKLSNTTKFHKTSYSTLECTQIVIHNIISIEIIS